MTDSATGTRNAPQLAWTEMASEERWPFDLVIEVKEGLAELRVRVAHVESELSELRHDVRRLDARLFQLMLAQIATLATAMGALVATLVTTLAG